MFLCTCGGVMFVKEIKPYPEGISAAEKLEYARKCTVECEDCKKVISDQEYD